MLVLSSGESIERLKLGGFEIVTRIEKAIDEAYATVNMLNNAIVPVLQYNLQSTANAVISDVNGSNVDTNIESFWSIRQLIKNSNIENDELKDKLIYVRRLILQNFKNQFSHAYGMNDKLETIFKTDTSGNIVDCDIDSLQIALRESIGVIDKEYAINKSEQLKYFIEETKDMDIMEQPK